MSYGKPITIATEAPYQLDSYGNGAAFRLWGPMAPCASGRGEERLSVFVEGDDAAEFWKDFTYADIHAGNPESCIPLGGRLEHLWNACEYGSLAS